jgi:hypothetical protein
MSIGQPLPKYWETFVQTLDNRCPNIGQRLPKHCATVDEVLGNPFPSIGQPLPKYGATVSHVLGNLSHALGNGFRALGHGTPILGELFPNAGKRPPNLKDASRFDTRVSACDSVVAATPSDTIPRYCWIANYDAANNAGRLGSLDSACDRAWPGLDLMHPS